MKIRFGSGSSALLGIVLILALLIAACGSDDPVPTATSAPTQAPTPTVAPNPAPTGVMGETEAVDPLALGEEIFQRTAGGIGCQTCHGEDASGGIAPSIIGRNSAEIIGALSRVDAMAFIDLTLEEVEAVVEYLISIGPPGITE